MVRFQSNSRLFPCHRHSLGILVLTLLLWAEGLAFSHAIRVEHAFDFASGSFGGQGRKNRNKYSQKEDSHATAANSMTATTCNSVQGSCKGSNKKKFGIFPIRQTTVSECQTKFNSCLSRTSESTSSSNFNAVLTTVRGGHSQHHSHGESGGHSHGSGDAHHQHHEPPYGIPLYGWKIIFQFVLTSLNVLSWYVPLNHKSLQENELGMSIANSFSGGVFLSLAFGHLIPECVAGFPQGVHSEVLPYMLILGGYMLIFFVEKVAFDAHGLLDHGHDHSHANGKADKPQAVSSESSSSPLTSGRSAVILLGALAVHSVLEMVSLGLSSNFADSAILSLSIGLHQPAESIALLVAFLKSGLPKKTIIQYLTAFSLMGPIGTATGMAVKEYASPLVDAIMLAIVAGTFVYVGATEVIPEEFEDQSNKWIKFGSLMSGIITIFAITQYTHGLEW